VGIGSESGGTELEAIQRAAPALTPEQAEDVRFIEARLHEQGKAGVLLTNGTGTGKTFSGMGEVKMMLDRGAKNVLVVVPSDKIGSDWVDTAHRFFGVKDAVQLPSTFDNAKDRRMVVTTYANFGQNNTLVKRPWDLGCH
jgi:superfamily II DNA or RNA helicase